MVSPGSALPSRLFAVAVSAAVIVAVTDPTTGGANGSGAGSGFGPGSVDATVSLGGLTKISSAEDFALSVLSVLFATVVRASEGAATAAIGVIRIVNDNRQATNTRRLLDEG